MNNTLTIYKRELGSYFNQLTAYIAIFIFLIFVMIMTFAVGRYMEVGDASLQYTFFYWHPLVYILLVPIVGMRMWSDEHRSNTIELLGTFPISTWSAILGKYMAAATVWLVALALTFPIWITTNYLGDPDNFVILSGYLGSFLVCLSFLAVTSLVSSFTKDQVVTLVLASFVCFLIFLIGFDQVARWIQTVFGEDASEVFTATGVWDHFRSLNRGNFRLQDFVWFATVIIVSLLGTNFILTSKRA